MTMQANDHSVAEHPLIHLLIVDHASADLGHIVRTLRVAGYVVQINQAERMKEIRDFIDYRPLDLILIRQSAGLPTAAEVAVVVRTSGQDIPMIALIDNSAPQRPLELLRAGAVDCCELDETEHLVLVVGRELRHLQLRRQTQAQAGRLQEAEERNRALLESCRDAIAYIHEGAHMYINPAYLKLFGYASQKAMEGVALMNLILPEDRDRLKRLLRDSMKSAKTGKTLEPVELTALDSKGVGFPVRISCLPTRMNDEPCFQILVDHPFEQQPRFEGAIDEPRTRDLLTGLYSRKFFINQLNRLCGATKGPGGAMLYILLTDYRAISKRAGPEAVDQLTNELAELLQQCVSTREVVARFSDAVFTLYSPDSSYENLLKLGEKISNAIKMHTTHTAQELVSTTSAIGICVIDRRHENAGQVLSQADQACEQARQAGSNQVQIYAPPAPKTSPVRQEEEIMAQIREAVSKERLQLLFQPIASFQGNAMERYKLYLHILDDNQQPLPMERLGAVAEKRGLMAALDRWAISKGLDTLVERSDKPTTLFIRISQNSVQQQEFCNWLERRLQEDKVPGNVLVLEVTEECTEKHFKEIKVLRERLREIGCGFALSHFGGRNNSEHILVNLVPEYIKLNSKLIDQLVKSKNEASHRDLKAITDKAREMHTAIIAADIASAPQMARVWQFGVTLIQGDMVQEASHRMDFDFHQFVA